MEFSVFLQNSLQMANSDDFTLHVLAINQRELNWKANVFYYHFKNKFCWFWQQKIATIYWYPITERQYSGLFDLKLRHNPHSISFVTKQTVLAQQPRLTVKSRTNACVWFHFILCIILKDVSAHSFLQNTKKEKGLQIKEIVYSLQRLLRLEWSCSAQIKLIRSF